MYYGWRGKVGLVFPHTGSAPEHEYHKYLPEGVTINTTRILFERVDPDGLYEMSQRVPCWERRDRISLFSPAQREA